MTQKSNHYYRLYTHWTNQKLQKSLSGRNMFDYKNIKPFDMAYTDQPGPQVLFASPGMLHAGIKTQIFYDFNSLYQAHLWQSSKNGHLTQIIW